MDRNRSTQTGKPWAIEPEHTGQQSGGETGMPDPNKEADKIDIEKGRKGADKSQPLDNPDKGASRPM